MKKVKSSIYFPSILKMALDKIKENDNKSRSFNQIIIDKLMNDKEIQNVIKDLKI